MTQSENCDTCARVVTDALNSVQGPKTWMEEDFVRAHRVGQARGDQPPPMIVKFRQWRHKIMALSDRDYRARLASKGVKLMNDLTRRQQAVVRQARESNQVAYFIKGKLTVQPRRPPGGQDPRSYAQMAATTSTTAGSAAGGWQRGGRVPSTERSPAASNTSQGGSPVSRHISEGASLKQTTGPGQPAVAETATSKPTEDTTTRAMTSAEGANDTNGENREGCVFTRDRVTQLEQEKPAGENSPVCDVSYGVREREGGEKESGGNVDGEREGGGKKEGRLSQRTSESGSKTGKSQANMHAFLRGRPDKNTTPDDTRRSSRSMTQTKTK